MNYKKPRATVRTGPESHGAQRLRRYMLARGWFLKKLHGGKYQAGLPDFVAMHSVHGLRWIETKAKGGKLRASQSHTFSLFEKHGQQVYVLKDETEYSILFKPKGNWKEYIRI